MASDSAEQFGKIQDLLAVGVKERLGVVDTSIARLEALKAQLLDEQRIIEEKIAETAATQQRLVEKRS